MATERQIAANRRNARNSAGPWSAGGKKRSGRNAYRHGFAVTICSSGNFAHLIDELARKILADASSPNSALALARARSAAEASLDLARVRQIKAALIDCVAAAGDIEVDQAEKVWSYLKAAGVRTRIKARQPTEPLPPLPPQQPERTAEALRRALPELIKLDRYERRAASRRKRAIILLDNFK